MTSLTPITGLWISGLLAASALVGLGGLPWVRARGVRPAHVGALAALGVVSAAAFLSAAAGPLQPAAVVLLLAVLCTALGAIGAVRSQNRHRGGAIPLPPAADRAADPVVEPGAEGLPPAEPPAGIDDVVALRASARDSSPEWFALVLRTGGLGHWDYDLRTGRVLWTEDHFRIFGYPDVTDDPVPLSHWRDCIHPDDVAGVSAALEAAKATHTPYRTTYRIRRADNGQVAWVESAGICHYSAAGVPVRMVGVVRDVTHLRLLQETLRRNLLLLTRFVDAAPAAIAMFDRQMRYLAVSDRFIADYGLDRAGLIGANHYDVFPEIPPRWRDAHRRCLQGETEKAEADPFPRRDGTVTWLRWEIQPWRDEHGDIGGLVLFTEDITRRKRAEDALERGREWFALAMNIGELGTWDWDLASGRVTWSEQYFRVLGYHEITEEPVEVDHWSARIHPEDRQRVVGALHAARDSCTPFREQYRILRADTGTLAWLEDAGVVIYDGDGRAVRMVGVLRDITRARLAQDSLQASTARLQAFIDAAPAAIVMFDRQMRHLAVSERFIANFGLERAAVIGASHYDVFPDIPPRWREIHRRCLQGETAQAAADRFERSDGSVLWHRWEIQPWRDDDGAIGGIVLFTEDVTARKQAEDALLHEKERAQVTLHSIGDAVITTTEDDRIEYLNPVAESLTGWSCAEAAGQPLTAVFSILSDVDRSPAATNGARPAVGGLAIGGSAVGGSAGELTAGALLVARDGTERTVSASAAPIRDGEGAARGSVLVFRDITEARRLERQLEYDASHDLLTGLPNRRAFELRLELAVRLAREQGFQHAVCFIDLDQFKVVNDSAGHPAGDALLKQVPKLLASRLRARDTLARLGGDEFAVLLEHCSLDEAAKIAQRIVTAFADWRFSWDGRPYQVGASVGVVAVTRESVDEGEILAKADVACYAAKEAGRNCMHVYRAEGGSVSSSHHAQLRMAAGLKEALEQERFRLYCQPIVPLSDVTGTQPLRFEVLIRMLDAERGLILPGQFIPAAERYGMMEAIDRWVVQRAFCQYVTCCRPQARTEITINLSGIALGREEFFEHVLDLFALTGMPPERVCFEITETAAIQKFEQAVRFAERIRAIGSKIALDDFGSGLSSFKYLRFLPTDYLKIDGAFVQNMLENSRDHAMVAAINDIGHQLGLATVAEYVDKPAIVQCLRDLGVDYAQGYTLGIPAPLERALEEAAAAA